MAIRPCTLVHNGIGRPHTLRALAVVFAWELPSTDLAGEHSEQNVIYDSIGWLRVAEQSPDTSATCFTRMVDRSLVRTGMRMSRAGNPVARASLALVASIVAPLSLGAPAALAGQRAAPPATIAVRADTLTITVPNSVNFGADSQGGSISASLGAVTVVDSRGGDSALDGHRVGHRFHPQRIAHTDHPKSEYRLLVRRGHRFNRRRYSRPRASHRGPESRAVIVGDRIQRTQNSGDSPNHGLGTHDRHHHPVLRRLGHLQRHHHPLGRLNGPSA